MPITPTTETSLLDVPSGTVLEYQVQKPHRGCVRVVAVAPDGRYKVVDEWTLYVDDLIAQNAAGETLAPLPAGFPRHSRAEWERLKAEAAAEEARVRRTAAEGGPV